MKQADNLETGMSAPSHVETYKLARLAWSPMYIPNLNCHINLYQFFAELISYTRLSSWFGIHGSILNWFTISLTYHAIVSVLNVIKTSLLTTFLLVVFLKDDRQRFYRKWVKSSFEQFNTAQTRVGSTNGWIISQNAEILKFYFSTISGNLRNQWRHFTATFRRRRP